MSAARDHRAKRAGIICVGRLYCDVIFTDLPRMPTAGTEVFAGGLGLHAGGGAAITAGHLAALGHEVSLAAYLPSLGFGDLISRELEAIGVDLSLCRTPVGHCDPQLTVALVQEGERAFVTRRAGAAFPPFGPDDLLGTAPRHIHIGEATTLTETPGLIDAARSMGATVSLDCSWDDELDATALAGLLPGIDVFLPNEAEFAHLRSLGVPEPFCRLTVVKQGAKGATAIIDGKEIHRPAETAQVIDTTGAGDAFNAAFLGARLAGRSLEECLKAGNARGAFAVAHRGGLGGVEPVFSGISEDLAQLTQR